MSTKKVGFVQCPMCYGTGTENVPCSESDYPCPKTDSHVPCGDSHSQTCTVCGGEKQFRPFLNVYHVTRQHGGHEEGGWYYDQGEPMASVPLDPEWDEEREQQIVQDLTRMFPPSKTPLHSVRSSGTYLIKRERKFAEFFPKEVPRYE